MARWRLVEPHYLMTSAHTKWEYIETDRVTGRQIRKQFDVPRYLHHEDPADWNVMEGRDSGYIAVSDGNNAQPNDIIFLGEPTPGMMALDDEARAISAKYKDKWVVPNGPLEAGEMGWAMKLTDHFVSQSDKIANQLADVASRPAPGMDQFMATMTKVLEQQQQIMMAVMGKQLGLEQIVDKEEPLPPPAEEPPNRYKVRQNEA